jgi:hypothetical protein
LLADKGGIARSAGAPKRCVRLQQRPVLAIGGVIDDAEHLDRIASELHVGAAGRQDRLHLAPLAQPCPISFACLSSRAKT